MAKKNVEIEIGVCFSDGTWDTEFVEIPTELAKEGNTDKIIDWINKNNPLDAVGLFIYHIP